MSGAERATQAGAVSKPRPEQPGRRRTADVEALDEVTAVFPQQRLGLLILDALRHNFQAEVVPEIDGRADDRRTVAVRRHVQDEGLIDLNLLDREALEVRQRRVARPEVIDRDLDAGLMQALQVTSASAAMIELSVISRLSFWGSTCQVLSSWATASGSSSSSRVRADRFTDTPTSMPAFDQACTCPSASLSTQAVSGLMRLVCSAEGMKSSGGSRPWLGWPQRTSASTFVGRPSATEMIGW